MAALAALGLCALVVSPRPRSGPSPSSVLELLRSALERSRWIAEPLFGLLVGASLASLVALIVLGMVQGRKGGARQGRKRNAQIVVMALVILAAWYIAQNRRTEQAPPPGLTPPAPAAAAADAPQAAAGPRSALEPRATLPPAFLFPAALALGAALCLAFVAAIALSDRGAPPASTESELAAAVTAIRRRLELGDEIRDAIVACYAEMCALFQGASDRAASLTAREFAALLADEGATEGEIAALTASFEKARYSNEACTEEDRERALNALASIEERHAGDPGRTGEAGKATGGEGAGGRA